MAVSVADLISKREQITNKRKVLYDMDTSIGTITVRQPSLSLIDDVMKMDGGRQTDIELIYESVVEPDLKDKELQKAYGCVAPSDIVPLLFQTGEIGSIAAALMKCAGYGKSIEARVHEEVKN